MSKNREFTALLLQYSNTLKVTVATGSAATAAIISFLLAARQFYASGWIHFTGAGWIVTLSLGATFMLMISRAPGLRNYADVIRDCSASYAIALCIYFTGGLNSPFFPLLLLFSVITALNDTKRLPTVFLPFIVTAYAVAVLAGSASSLSEPGLPAVLRIAALLIANAGALAILPLVTAFMARRLDAEKERVRKLDHQVGDLKKRLVEADKLPSLGILVGGVSHEIKTPLTSVMGFAELALQKMIRKTASPEELRDYLKTILQSADHCLIIVQDLLDFARSSGTQKVVYRSVNMNSCIESTVNIIMHHMKIKNIQVMKDYDTDLPPIRGNYNQLRQVLLNLLMNARDAIKKDGKIRICSRTEDDEVIITIEDDGAGIDKETLEHIFEPFFTTKETGKGTGLGLAVSQGLIHEHNGSISIESTPNVGTKVTLRLPAEVPAVSSTPKIA